MARVRRRRARGAGEASAAEGQQPWTMSTRDFAEAEAEAERHASEEARKEADAKADAVAARAAASNFEYDGLDDFEASASFRLEAEAAQAAVKAVMDAGGASVAAQPPLPSVAYLFERQPLAKQSKLSSKMSESFGDLPKEDDFLSRLTAAEQASLSPGGMRSRMGSGLFARVGA